MEKQEKEMFLTATNFLESANYCFNAKDSFFRGFHGPAIVNYSFACEIYLKLLLLNQELKDIKTCNLTAVYSKYSSFKAFSPENQPNMRILKIK